MECRPLIYVRRITNLSDARYCAGMGVDFLGFMIDPDSPDFVNDKMYREILGWVSGPFRVIETARHAVREDTLRTYEPEFVHGPPSLLVDAVPRLVECSFAAFPDLKKTLSSQPAYFILTQLPDEKDLIEHEPIDSPVLLSIDARHHNLLKIREATGAAGFMLSGQKEAMPGLSDYGQLSRVLDQL